MFDVYFVNMVVVGLVFSVLAFVYLLGFMVFGWVLWGFSSEVYVTLLVLFNVCSLVIMYFTVLFCLDCYIERVLSRIYMFSVYNIRYVCGFVWGGALFISFFFLLFYICSYVAVRIVECFRM